MPKFKKRKSEIGIYQGKLVIGVVGTHKGVGVTHFSLLLAGYISECLGRKTAYVEHFPQNDIQYFQYYINGSMDCEMEKAFQYNRVTYYRNVKVQNIGEIIGDHYDCVILDLGSDFTRGKNEFERCDLKIVVSSLSLWKRQILEQFVQTTSYIKNSEKWIYTIPFSEQKHISTTSKELQINMFGIPYEPNPFKLSSATIQLFQKFI